MAKARARVIIQGRVQGVFFRDSTRREAAALGLTGWVRNRYDGSVEVLAEGEKDAVEKLIEWCGHGPPHARVTNLEVDWRAPTGEFDRFGVAATA